MSNEHNNTWHLQRLLRTHTSLCFSFRFSSLHFDANDAMNASRDTEMAEALPSNAAPIQDDVARGLLTAARQLVDQGKPSQALQAVVVVMRSKGGDGAVIQILQRARELYTNKVQASSEADQLASLFAECAIAEAQPARTEPAFPPAPSQMPNTISGSPLESDVYKTSILSETGRKQIMLDAFSDGSSFICLQCGGLVSVNRKDEHYAYWCQV